MFTRSNWSNKEKFLFLGFFNLKLKIKSQHHPSSLHYEHGYQIWESCLLHTAPVFAVWGYISILFLSRTCNFSSKVTENLRNCQPNWEHRKHSPCSIREKKPSDKQKGSWSSAVGGNKVRGLQGNLLLEHWWEAGLYPKSHVYILFRKHFALLLKQSLSF